MARKDLITDGYFRELGKPTRFNPPRDVVSLSGKHEYFECPQIGRTGDTHAFNAWLVHGNPLVSGYFHDRADTASATAPRRSRARCRSTNDVFDPETIASGRHKEGRILFSAMAT